MVSITSVMAVVRVQKSIVKYFELVLFLNYYILRIFWLVALVVSMFVTALSISRLITHVQRNPILTVVDESAISISDIYFPAVTICPSLRLSREKFDSLWILNALNGGKLNVKNLTELQ